MRNGEPNMYGALAALLVNHEGALRTYATAFLTFNVVAVPLISDAGRTETLKLGIGFIGVLAHGALLLLALRELRWIRDLRDSLADLELFDEVEEQGVRVQIFSDPIIVHPTYELDLRAAPVLIIGGFFVFFWLFEMMFHAVLLGEW